MILPQSKLTIWIKIYLRSWFQLTVFANKKTWRLIKWHGHLRVFRCSQFNLPY